jgi:hypothetical protein
MARVSQQAAELAAKTLNEAPTGVAEIWVIPTEYGFAYRASRTPLQIAGFEPMATNLSAPAKEVKF